MKRVVLYLLLVLMANAAFSEPFKVVYHINEREKMGMLLASVDELLQTDPDADIKVVVHGSAILKLINSSSYNRQIKNLMSKGVAVGGCNNSILKNSLPKDSLIKGVGLLEDGGVRELLLLQQQGYLYIKI
ncbi:DsrE family protein [Dasania marina]|uniref:DsrE family protein n=1 Tax=Dasania marina TaxID=471499 RepID=UPI0030DB473B|tara:strand:+ start:4928 stop:5320 length:393 start_codon:yes stop_codon:yes gene_type:complete